MVKPHLKDGDQPLTVSVVKGKIIISIGVETLKYCHNETEKGFDPLRGYGSGFMITDAVGFAKDVSLELLKEREDGSSIVTDLFDDAIKSAGENGSIHIEERFDWFCEQCDKGMRDSERGYPHNDGIIYCSQECAEKRDSNR